MKLKKTILIILILLTNLQIAFGQAKPQAILVDEFGRLTLEDVYSRLDMLRQELQKSPEAVGYLVIHPGRDSAKVNYRVEKKYKGFIRSQASVNRLDSKRLLIVRSSEESEIKFQFWKVIPGAALPFKIEEIWTEPPVDLSEPFVFGTTSIYDIWFNFAPEFYADLIKGNENLRGHIVVTNRSRKTAAETAESWIKTLTEEFKVPRERLKVFFNKSGKSNNSPTDTEFWIVPKRKK